MHSAGHSFLRTARGGKPGEEGVANSIGAGVFAAFSGTTGTVRYNFGQAPFKHWPQSGDCKALLDLDLEDALQGACVRKEFDRVTHLIRCNADVNALDERVSRSLVRSAIAAHQRSLVQMLADVKLDFCDGQQELSHEDKEVFVKLPAQLEEDGHIELSQESSLSWSKCRGEKNTFVDDDGRRITMTLSKPKQNPNEDRMKELLALASRVPPNTSVSLNFLLYAQANPDLVRFPRKKNTSHGEINIKLHEKLEIISRYSLGLSSQAEMATHFQTCKSVISTILSLTPTLNDTDDQKDDCGVCSTLSSGTRKNIDRDDDCYRIASLHCQAENVFGRTIHELISETREGMDVRGRDGIVYTGSYVHEKDDILLASSTEMLTKSSLRIKGERTTSIPAKLVDGIFDLAWEQVLLRDLYTLLIEPVESCLSGVEELLIVPHKELFEVPWAALVDSNGHYLIEKHVLLVAPSLRVLRQATKHQQQQLQNDIGHMLVVGNPIPNVIGSLKQAEIEANAVVNILSTSDVEVRSLMKQTATKDRVKTSLEGAKWAHFACHSDIDSDSLVLAIPTNSTTFCTMSAASETAPTSLIEEEGTTVPEVEQSSSFTLSSGGGHPITFKISPMSPNDIRPLMTQGAICRMRADLSHLLFEELSLKSRLSFDIGTHVQCKHCRRGWAKPWITGRVHMHNYEQPAGTFHAYQIRLDGGGDFLVSEDVDFSDKTASAETRQNELIRWLDGNECQRELRQAKEMNLSMHEVQRDVRLGSGATVVLSACNTGRGEIMAEGVMGLTRGFLLSGASAIVVSLWAVDDESTSALMQHMYQELVSGLNVPQALRLAMLRLACRHPTLHLDSKENIPGQDNVKDGVQSELKNFNKIEPQSTGGLRAAVMDQRMTDCCLGAGFIIEMLSDSVQCAFWSASGNKDQENLTILDDTKHDIEQSKENWSEFFKSEVRLTCILDFPYGGERALNLPTHPNDMRLLERLYCFEDCEDEFAVKKGARRLRRVILKVHTLHLWRDWGNKPSERTSKITSIKVMYVNYSNQKGCFEQETGRHFLQLLPVSRVNAVEVSWQIAYQKGHLVEIEWEWRKLGSIPFCEDPSDLYTALIYDQVRKKIQQAEEIFQPSPLKAYKKSFNRTDGQQVHYQKGIWQSNSMIRGAHEVEYEVFVPPSTSSFHEREDVFAMWKRPMYWASFLVVGASTRLPCVRNSKGGGHVIDKIGENSEKSTHYQICYVN